LEQILEQAQARGVQFWEVAGTRALQSGACESTSPVVILVTDRQRIYNFLRQRMSATVQQAFDSKKDELQVCPRKDPHTT
jgi:hypothetical protein